MNSNLSIKCILLSFLYLLYTGCGDTHRDYSEEINTVEIMSNNMLENMGTNNLEDFKWLNQPKSYTIDNGILSIIAERETDFFNNPEDQQKTASAPLLYKEVSGDFVATALVKPDFSAMWNAVSLMVHIDNDNWIKFAFENSDASGKSIVSVVTKTVSDDANGAVLNDQDQVWLKIIRKNSVFSLLWSIDGIDYKMARLCTLPDIDTIKIGIEAQSPVGPTASHAVHFFTIEKMTVKDLRKGE